MRSRFEIRESEDEGSEDRWVVSYADFITLLFAFFVVMYSISSVNEGKFRVLSESMVEVFQDPNYDQDGLDGISGLPAMLPQNEAVGEAPTRILEMIAQDDFPAPVAEINARDVRTVDLAKKIEQSLAAEIDMGQIRVRETEDWTEVELDSEFMFASGEGRLGGSAATVLGTVITVIKQTDTPVRVEGFTDNIPVTGGPYGSNWALSAARAANVAEAIADAGIDPDRLSATGFGELHPVAENSTVDGRRQNRRVVIAIAKHADVPPASPTVAAARAEQNRPEELPLKPLQRVTQLPGRLGITL